MGYFENYSHEEIEQIVALSTSYKDFARKIGYSHTCSGDTLKMLRLKLEDYDTEHFGLVANSSKRTPEDTFVSNSTASQHTLRELYKRGNYSTYECAICGQQPFWNEKEMTLILDHINGINNDDVLENLRWVCPNCNSQLETTGSRNPNRKVFAKKFYCIDCGKEISKGSNRCQDCSSKARTTPLEEMPVSRNQLKSLIRNKSFVQIGRDFGVSDNAIRKWCEKFDLPRKKTDISKYSDEEWNNL